MNNGSMFSDLCRYESEDFYREHKTIRFDTLDSFGEYEVIAAFKTVAYSEEGFKYYHFVNAADAAAFDEFISKCKDLALYDTGVTAEYGDQLITVHLRVFPGQRTDGGCGQAGGWMRASLPWKGGETSGQGDQDKIYGEGHQGAGQERRCRPADEGGCDPHQGQGGPQPVRGGELPR